MVPAEVCTAPGAQDERHGPAAADAPRLLIVAFEEGRWGAARLVRPLDETGFRVAALCPDANPVAQTRFLRRHFPLAEVRNGRVIAAAFAACMRGWRPELVVPADERAVAFLQSLVRRAACGRPTRLDDRSLAVLRRSLGKAARFDALMMKSHTVRLARSLGIRVPRGGTAESARDALRIAERLGYPVFLKRSFSWAGLGVTRCDTPAQLAAAYGQAVGRRRLPFWRLLKAVSGRGWYPACSDVDVQQAIDGTPAFYTALAMDGEMLSGFAGFVQQTGTPNGPSSVVRLGPDPAMAAAARRLIRATGATGFIGFDFIIEAGSGKPVFLECNPRPIPSCHLGKRIGADLCAALRAGLCCGPPPAETADRAETIALFPQEWQRAPDTLFAFPGFVDVPTGDAPLLRCMLGDAALPQEAEKFLLF